MRMMVSTMAMILGLGLMTLVGCSSTPAGVEKSWGGTYSSYVDALPAQVIAAADQAAQELGLEVESKVASQLDGALYTRTAKGKKISIDVERYTDNISSIAIKVGKMGDERLSLQLLDAIRAKLANRGRTSSPPSSSNLNLLR